MLCRKSLHESCTMGRRLVVVKLICSLGHCECDGHIVQSQSTASHCRLTSPTGDCSQMHSKVSSDWLPSYIKATQLVLEIFKMAGYFPDLVYSSLTPTKTDIHLNHTQNFNSCPTENTVSTIRHTEQHVTFGEIIGI